MVDVSAKAVTLRRARAAGRVRISEQAAALLRDGALPKGDGLAVARVAAIAAVKLTPQIIPLCHPVPVDAVEVSLEVDLTQVRIVVDVTSLGRTGAEMEALHGVTAAGLSIIDMVKAVDPHTVIEDVRVIGKSGGTRSAPDRDGGQDGSQALPPMGYVIVSDRCSAGEADDHCGPIIAHGLHGVGADRVESRLVADDEAAIQAAVGQLAAAGCRVILTSGGTGLSPRDRTPEALTPLIDRPIPGIGEALRASARTTPRALLSRSCAGVMEPKPERGIGAAVFLAALPGAPAGVEQAMGVLAGLLAHILAQMDGIDDHRTREA
jgi:cyclic pyranopterin phosphate synthase